MKRTLIALSLAAGCSLAAAGSATFDIRFTVQVREACQFLRADAQGVDARCTVGISAPMQPGLLPDAPASVQALGDLRLSTQEPYGGEGGGTLLHYRPGAGAEAQAVRPDSAATVNTLTYY